MGNTNRKHPCLTCKVKMVQKLGSRCLACHRDFMGLLSEPTEEDLEKMIAEQLPTMPFEGSGADGLKRHKKRAWQVPIIRVTGHGGRKKYLREG